MQIVIDIPEISINDENMEIKLFNWLKQHNLNYKHIEVMTNQDISLELNIANRFRNLTEMLEEIVLLNKDIQENRLFAYPHSLGTEYAINPRQKKEIKNDLQIHTFK